jgi:hypothetical protein
MLPKPYVSQKIVLAEVGLRVRVGVGHEDPKSLSMLVTLPQRKSRALAVPQTTPNYSNMLLCACCGAQVPQRSDID